MKIRIFHYQNENYIMDDPDYHLSLDLSNAIVIWTEYLIENGKFTEALAVPDWVVKFLAENKIITKLVICKTHF